jgi:hypothetical protein
VFWLFWDVDYVTSTVHFRLRAQLPELPAWFGLGFSDYGEITNADVAVFWTDPDGWHHFQVTHKNPLTDLPPFLTRQSHGIFTLLRVPPESPVCTPCTALEWPACNAEITYY